jgi:hypothetical protein
MSRLTFPRAASALPALAACLFVAACATPQQRAGDRENLLTAAGFTARPANTPERVTSLRTLPANKVVQRVRSGTVRYVYADPLVCGCLYVGDQAAYGRYQQEVFQRRLADEQAMTAQMNQFAWDDGPWGPIY